MATVQRPAGTAQYGESADVALLIDWENLKISLNRNFGATPNITSLVQAARDIGRLVTATAYADWTQDSLRFDAPNLYRAGIDPIYVPRYSIRQDAPGRESGVAGQQRSASQGITTFKNSADVRLAVDAVDVCSRLPNVSTFILVTGDGDLVHALNYIRLNGRRVVVVGVGGAISSLFAGAADEVLRYEQDIDPVEAGPAETIVPVATPSGGPGIPSLETVFGWITAVLQTRGGEDPFPFTRLGNELKRTYGLNTREWYGIPFKDLMLRAEAAGHVHLSTSGGIDYASPGTLAAPSLSLEDSDDDDQNQETTGIPGERVRFDTLGEEEQVALIGYLKHLQDSSPFMVFKFVVDNLVYFSVLPRLSREQVEGVVNGLREQGMLRGSEEVVTTPDGRTYRRTRLTLNEQHEAVRQTLDRGASGSGPGPDVERAFAMLPDVLAQIRQSNGHGYFPEVQKALEAQLGQRLREIGFNRPMAFFQAAERAGLVRLHRLPNGADILLQVDEPAPENEAVPATKSSKR